MKKHNPFYDTPEWRRKRRDVIQKDKGECQIHKAKGAYRRATYVHHVKHLEDYPELALEDYYIDENGEKQRQLISVCKECHETVCHPERLRHTKEPLTKERW